MRDQAWQDIWDRISEARPADALELLEKELHSQPQDPDLLALRVPILMELGQPREARRLGRSLAKKFPENGLVIALCALAEAALLDDDRAEELYSRALELAPDDYVVVGLAGLYACWALPVLFEEDSGQRLMERYEQIAPENVHKWFLIFQAGRGLKESGLDDHALKQLTTHYPDHPATWIAQGHACRKAQDREQALKWFLRAREVADTAELKGQCALCLLGLKRPEEAREMARAAVAQNPACATALAVLMQLGEQVDLKF